MTEDELLKRLQGVYSDALTQAIRNQKDFLKKVQDVQSGKIKPPQYYVDRDEVDKWRQGFIDELARRGKIVDGIMKSINEAGQEASRMISGEMVDVFADARDEQIASLVKESSVAFGFEPSFAVYNKKQIEILMKDEGQSPFSKIAYKNLGKNQDVRRRLQHELSVSIINGESQEKMIKRIKGVAESSYKKARTIAQTERTRVQAQGAHEAAKEAEAMGIRTYKKWYCAMMPTSRDNHRHLHGACALTDEPFKYSADGKLVEVPLMFPGDSSAPADQVVNCHCTYVEHVLLDNEDIVEGRLVANDRRRKFDDALGSDEAETNFWNISGTEDQDTEYSVLLNDKYESGTQLAKSVFDYIVPEGGVVTDGHYVRKSEVEPTAFYSESERKIYMNYDEDKKNIRGAGTTYFHEHAHFIDDKLGYPSHSYRFIKSIDEEYEAFINRFTDKNKKVNVFKRISYALSNYENENMIHGIEDILFGLSNGKIKGIWHHRKKYYKGMKVYEEAFSHMFEASFSEEKLTAMKQYFPKSYAIFVEELETRFNDYRKNREKILEDLRESNGKMRGQ